MWNAIKRFFGVKRVPVLTICGRRYKLDDLITEFEKDSEKAWKKLEAETGMSRRDITILMEYLKINIREMQG